MKKTIKNLSWAMCLCASTLISCSGRKIGGSGQVGGNARNNSAFLQRIEQKGAQVPAPQQRATASTSTTRPQQPAATATSFSIIGQPGLPDCTAEMLSCAQQTGNTCGYHTIKNAALLWSYDGCPRDKKNDLEQIGILTHHRSRIIPLSALQQFVQENRRTFLQAAQLPTTARRGRGDAVDADITNIHDEFTNIEEVLMLAQHVGIDDNARSIFHPDFLETHTRTEREHARLLLTTQNAQHLFLVNSGSHWFLIAAHRTMTKINFFVIDSAARNKNILNYQEYVVGIAEYIQSLA